MSTQIVAKSKRAHHASRGALGPGWRRVGVVLILGLAIAAAACGSSTTGTTPGDQPTAGATATNSPTSAPTPVPSVVWRLVHGPTTMPAANEWGAITALSATDAWAAGQTYGDSEGIPRQTLIERWDGTAWHIVPSGGYDVLNAMAAVSANDVWAVGGSYNYGHGYNPYKSPLTMHWNGTKWSIVPTPDEHAITLELTGVVALATNDVWAVGRAQMGTAAVDQPLVEHWTGSAWHIVPTSLVANVWGSSLHTIAAIPGTKGLWAVGSFEPQNTTSGNERALIERWDGSAWHTVTTPSLPKGITGSALSGVVALSATNAWAVGTGFTASEPALRTLVLHWDGTAWTVVMTPTIFGSLAGVAAANINDVRAVGAAGDGNHQTALILQWDGSTWHRISPPTPSEAQFTALNNVTTDGAGTFWAVGGAHTTGPGSTFGDARTYMVRCP